jgi:hypothetical protein
MGKRNNVEVIDAQHMDTINDKHSREKKEK